MKYSPNQLQEKKARNQSRGALPEWPTPCRPVLRRLGLVCCLLAGWACRSDVERIVRSRVDEQVHLARKKAQARCDEELYAEAERIADSVLLYGSRPSWADSLDPGRPARPVAPPPHGSNR